MWFWSRTGFDVYKGISGVDFIVLRPLWRLVPLAIYHFAISGRFLDIGVTEGVICEEMPERGHDASLSHAFVLAIGMQEMLDAKLIGGNRAIFNQYCLFLNSLACGTTYQYYDNTLASYEEVDVEVHLLSYLRAFAKSEKHLSSPRTASELARDLQRLDDFTR